MRAASSIAVLAMALLTAAAVAQTVADEEDASQGKREKVETAPLPLADGELSVAAPKIWERVKPRNRIIEVELSVPGEHKDDPVGRLTIMASGGSIEANLGRWAGQFRGGKDSKKPEVDRETVGGMEVVWFDASGTFLDSPRGPFGPKTEKPGHRMLAAILQTGRVGNYFFKLVGPTDLVEKHSEAFQDMIRSADKSAAAETKP